MGVEALSVTVGAVTMTADIDMPVVIAVRDAAQLAETGVVIESSLVYTFEGEWFGKGGGVTRCLLRRDRVAEPVASRYPFENEPPVLGTSDRVKPLSVFR
jgi:hypothetical protein